MEKADSEKAIWPENDPARTKNVILKIFDRLYYPYMGAILKKGSQLHKERLEKDKGFSRSSSGSISEAGTQQSQSLHELCNDDLFNIPKDMDATNLQKEFKSLLGKELEILKRRNGDKELTRIEDRKQKQWALVRVLLKISKPSYLPAAFYQLLTVAAQCLNPIVIQRLLILLDENPKESVFREGIVYAISLFLLSIIDGIAQERHKFLSFQAGVASRAATITSIYDHMLNLTAKGKKNLLTGATINLVATDCQKIFEVFQEGHLLWSLPLSMIVVTILLLTTLGPTTLAGMASMYLMVPLVRFVMGKMIYIRHQRAAHTDKRVDVTTSMLQAIRFCKLNHYEEKFLQRVSEARKEEMRWVRKELSYVGLTQGMTVLTPVLACAITFILYPFVEDGKYLTSAETFTTLVLFSVLRFPINYGGVLMGKAAQGLEACSRLAEFFDREAHSYDESKGSPGRRNDATQLLSITNGNFIVGNLEDDEDKNNDRSAVESPMSKASFTLSDINVEVEMGETMVVVGPVGSGKSTLLNALVGEVSPIPNSEGRSEIVLDGNIAFASQTPFILNATLRENILFGLEYNEELYQQVLEACNLIPDLNQLGPAKDLTEIGERGVNLSGGQKARISVARCVYSQPSVALFDDVLSALDASTAKNIFEHLFDASIKNHSLLSKTAVLLVTHAAHFLSRVDKIMVLVNGKTAFQGTWDEMVVAKPSDPDALEAVLSICSSVQERNEGSERPDTKRSSTGDTYATNEEPEEGDHSMLMTVEEREFGLAGSETWLKWFKYAGGFFFMGGTILFLLIDRGFYVINEWWLATWTTAIDEPVQRFGIIFQPQSAGNSAQYEFIKVYVIILVISFTATFTRSQWIVRGGANCAEIAFDKMLSRVIYAPMSYFETTPLGRILNRLTYDVEILDITLATSMTVLMISTGWFVAGLVVQITILPWSAAALLIILVAYYLLLLYYRKSATDLQRLDAVSRSPIQACLTEGIDGSTTIKAFGQIPHFERKFKKALDENTSAMMNFIAVQRWLGARFQTLGSFTVLFASICVVSFNNILRLETGIAAMLVIWTSNFTITLSFFSKAVSESEAYITSLERIDKMDTLPQEAATKTGKDIGLPASWPSDGKLSFENVCLRYRPRLPLTLKGLTFTAEAGQRVGVVGRTGAGKSTIAVALFRLVEIESGKILLDGHDITKLGLEDVRGRKNGMCIIAQDPVLFSGSLRECLDPWGVSTDEKIVEALQMVKVANVEKRGSAALEDYVDEGGRNYSVGERQLLCLARAVLYEPKVLVLDEATASVDGDTDAFIQEMIRTRFKGTTLLTVAHRLNTIMDYDVILAMDGGKVAEFGRPVDLLKDENGLFSSLVDSTGKESSAALRNMVRD